MANPAMAREENYVLTLEDIGNLAREGGKPAETLMNVVALIARRFQTGPIWCWPPLWVCVLNVSACCAWRSRKAWRDW